MLDRVGLHTDIAIEHPSRRGELTELGGVMVDTGSEYTWVPGAVLAGMGFQPERSVRFLTADGRQIERDVCFAILHTAGTSAPDIVVFAEPSDMILLGAHTLEGMNLRVDLVGKRLVPAGPVPVAA